jgi:hypothetical protein
MKDRNGWLVDKAGNLLVWVPEEYQKFLLWPRTCFVIGGGVPTIAIDFAGVCHGKEWAKCAKPGDGRGLK